MPKIRLSSSGIMIAISSTSDPRWRRVRATESIRGDSLFECACRLPSRHSAEIHDHHDGGRRDRDGERQRAGPAAMSGWSSSPASVVTSNRLIRPRRSPRATCCGATLPAPGSAECSSRSPGSFRPVPRPRTRSAPALDRSTHRRRRPASHHPRRSRRGSVAMGSANPKVKPSHACRAECTTSRRPG